MSRENCKIINFMGHQQRRKALWKLRPNEGNVLDDVYYRRNCRSYHAFKMNGVRAI